MLLFPIFFDDVALRKSIPVFQEYERAVIFRLGRIKEGGPVGPGLFFIIPCMDQVSTLLKSELPKVRIFSTVYMNYFPSFCNLY